MARLTLLLVLLVLALAACGGDDESAADTVSTAPATTEAEAPAATTAEEPTDGCQTVPQPAPRPNGTGKAPTELLDPTKTYRLVVETTCGPFTITLDPKASPNAVASFVALAREDFFDGTFFHRIVPGFVIQGGDPSGVGTGGPGYLTIDKPAADTIYTMGVVAMAKSAVDPPGTAGSQFFVVTTQDAGLPPDYAVIGSVTDGQETVALIGSLGDETTETPTLPVVIEDMVVKVS